MKDQRHKLLLLGLLVAAALGGWFFSRREDPAKSETRKVAPSVPSQRPPETPMPPKVIPPTARATVDMKKIENLRSQIKLNLSGIYTAEASMHADYKRYSTDLTFMGMGPGPEMNFKYGFIHPFRPKDTPEDSPLREDPTRMSTDETLSEEEGASYTPEAEAIDLSQFEKYCRKGCTASETGFEVIIVAPLPNGDYDVWLIDEEKKIVQVRNGLLPNP